MMSTTTKNPRVNKTWVYFSLDLGNDLSSFFSFFFFSFFFLSFFFVCLATIQNKKFVYFVLFRLFVLFVISVFVVVVCFVFVCF